MIIGVDIDGVLIDDDTYRLDCMSKYSFENNLGGLETPDVYETKIKLNSAQKVDYNEKYFYEYVKNAPCRRFASEVIKKMHDEGHKIIIITGRFQTIEDFDIVRLMRKYTEEWLKKNDIIYDEICYAVCPKTNEVKENNIDIMIEDSPEVINNIHNFVKIFCYDNRYNTNINYENVTRVYSWYDIYGKIKEM